MNLLSFDCSLDEVSKNNCSDQISKPLCNFPRNILAFPPNSPMTHPEMTQSPMMSINDSPSKKLAYVGFEIGTEFNGNIDSFCDSYENDLDVRTKTAKYQQDLPNHVTISRITSDHDSKYSKNTTNMEAKTSEKSFFQEKVEEGNGISSTMSIQSSTQSSRRLNSASSPEKNFRSLVFALSNVTKKRDTVSMTQNRKRKISEAHQESYSKSEVILKSPQSKSIRKFPGTPVSKTPYISTPPSGLTLSAFRRPEASVRLTDCPEDCFIHQTYHIRRVLGHGASSTVRLAIRRSDGKRHAVKCIPKYTILSERNRLDEIALLRALDHPNIVSLIDVFETEHEVQLVFEYCAGGELFDAVLGKNDNIMQENTKFLDATNNVSKKISEQDAAHIVSSLLRALRYLHFLGIVHRDVKPENVLLTSTKDGETDVKLSDFGTARALYPQTLPIMMNTRKFGPFLPGVDGDSSPTRRSRAYSRVGSDYYTAPEVHSGNGYDTSADMYSLGVTMYIILFGKFPTMPFDVSCMSDSEWKHISPQAKNLLLRLLDCNPTQRITAADAIKHDWIKQNTTSEKKRRSSGSFRKGETTKRKRVKKTVTFDVPLFRDLDLFKDTSSFVMIDEREGEDGSIDMPLRPICYV